MAIIQSSTSSDSLIIDPTAKAARVTLYDINGSVISFNGAGSSFNATFPSTGNAAGYSDGTDMQSARVFDTDSGSGVEYVLGVSLRLPNNGGSIAGGTAINPLRIDPTGSTTQPVSGSVSISNFPATQPISAVSLPLPTGAASAANQSTIITLLSGGLPAALGSGGGLKIDGSGTALPVSAAALPLPSGASTSALQSTGNASLASLDSKTVAVNTGAVTISSALPAGSNVIGHVITDSGSTTTVSNFPATQTVAGSVSVSNLPVSPSVFADFGTDVTLNIKASAGAVLSLLCQNLNSAMRWLQLHNTATIPSSGAVPIVSIPIPGTTTAVIGTDFFTSAGFNFSTGIAFAFSTTSGTYTAGSAADQMTQVSYK